MIFNEQLPFGAFYIGIKLNFQAANFGNAHVWRLKAPTLHISIGQRRIIRNFFYFLATGAAKNHKKERDQVGPKFYVILGGCASSRLISGFSACVE